MRRAGVLLCFAFAALVCRGRGGGETSAALLARARQSMRQALARLPDYTCIETITRSISDGNPPRPVTLDRVRLQVAVVRGNELFSWPGATPFERGDPREIVAGGLTGTGDFANFTRAVFATDAPTFTSGEEEIRSGRRTIRYDYQVPLQKSGYLLRSGPARAKVDYHGSFWVDPETARVLSLEVHVDERVNEIPETLDMYDVRTVIEYRTIAMGGAEFPFPAVSELTVRHRRSPVVTGNRIEFGGCRQYAAQSTVRFG